MAEILVNYIYINYTLPDRDVAKEIAHYLNQLGIHVWRDIEQISPGENWLLKTEEGLKKADIMLFIASINSISSPYAQDSLYYFIRNEKPVIYLIVDDTGEKYVPYIDRQWVVDFREDFKSGVRKVLKTLTKKDILEKKEKAIKTGKILSKGYVFLSYSEKDRDFVQEMIRFLGKQQFAYWDYTESDRNYHEQLFIELENAIQESVAVFSILSDDWKKSFWAVREYMYSLEIKKPVYLINAKKRDPILLVAGVHYIDFTMDMNKGYEDLKTELNRKGFI